MLTLERILTQKKIDSNNSPPPAVIAAEIVEDLQAALEQFKLIAGDLGLALVETSAP